MWVNFQEPLETTSGQRVFLKTMFSNRLKSPVREILTLVFARVLPCTTYKGVR